MLHFLFALLFALLFLLLFFDLPGLFAFLFLRLFFVITNARKKNTYSFCLHLLILLRLSVLLFLLIILFSFFPFACFCMFLLMSPKIHFVYFRQEFTNPRSKLPYSGRSNLHTETANTTTISIYVNVRRSVFSSRCRYYSSIRR